MFTKRKRIISLLLALVMVLSYAPMLASVKAEEGEEKLEAPQSGYYYPDDVIGWSLDKYPDQKNNISTTKLAERFALEGKGVNAKGNQGKVMAITIANSSTSGNSPQGKDNYKDGYAFTHWQYVDSMIYWGGSAGEGIIVPPSAEFTDSAHKNGVEVYGTVFFPPAAYGGDQVWLYDFIKQDENGNYLVADGLIEMAESLGFDGWFINQETYANQKIANGMKEFLDYYRENSDKKIIWYDSMTSSGSVSWQGELNAYNVDFFQAGDKRRSDEVFIDFRWTWYDGVESSQYAIESTGRSPYDLAFGFDVQGNNNFTNKILSGKSDIEKLGLSQGYKLKGSIGLYCPDSAMRIASNLSGQEFWDKVWYNESMLWINDKDKLGDTPNYRWRGISSYVNEKTPITSFPFITYFNMGAGENFYQAGRLVKEGGFVNRSTQDIMPSYRWLYDNQAGNNLKPGFDLDKVYYGGSSLNIAGTVAKGGSSEIMLYGADALIEENMKAEVLVKDMENIDLELLLVFDDQTKLSLVGNKDQSSDWISIDYDLSEYEGKKVREFGFKVKGLEDGKLDMAVGQLAISDMEYDRNVEIKDLIIGESYVKDGVLANFYLNIEYNRQDHYGANIYYADKDGNKKYIATINNDSTFIENLRRLSDENNLVDIIVVPLAENKEEILENAKKLSFDFGELAKPEADFTADKRIVEVGQEVTFTQKDSISTSDFIWEIPGASTEYGQGEEFTVSFAKPGLYNVKHTAANIAGQDVKLEENYITVINKLPDYVNLGKDHMLDAEASGEVNAAESKYKAFDGSLNTKWCDNSHDIPWLEVELDDVYTIVGFDLYHAESGGESVGMNSREYYIEVKENADDDWVRVVDVVDNTAGETSHSSMVDAKYVRLTLPRAEQNGTVARIYEFVIKGLILDDIEELKNAEEISRIRQAYYDTELTEEEKAKYDPDQVAALEAERERARQVLETNSYTEDDKDLAQNMLDLYEALEEVSLVNKNELEEQIAAAEAVDKDELTEESRLNLENSLAAAKLVLENPDASQEEVDSAVADLKSVLENLEYKPQVNKESLKAVIDRVDEMTSDYLETKTDESVEALLIAYTEALEVYQDEMASQEQVDTALENLIAAIADLEDKELVEELSTNSLEVLIEVAEAIDRDKLTEDSATRLAEAIAEAKDVLETAESQDEIDQAVVKLQDAIGGIEFRVLIAKTLYVHTKTQLYEEADLDSKHLGQLLVGDKLEGFVVGDFLQVDLDGSKAYVDLDMLQESPPVSSGYARFSQVIRDENDKIIGRLPKGQFVAGLVKGNRLEIEYRGTRGRVYLLNLSENPLDPSGYARFDQWVRDKQGRKIGILKKGIYVKGHYEDGKVRFNFKGQAGYVFAKNLQKEKPAGQYQGYARFTQWVRDKNGKKIGIVNKGFLVKGEEAGVKVKFSFKGKDGYVYKQNLQDERPVFTGYAKFDQWIRDKSGNKVGILKKNSLVSGEVVNGRIFVSQGSVEGYVYVLNLIEK